MSRMGTSLGRRPWFNELFALKFVETFKIFVSCIEQTTILIIRHFNPYSFLFYIAPWAICFFALLCCTIYCFLLCTTIASVIVDKDSNDTFNQRQVFCFICFIFYMSCDKFRCRLSFTKCECQHYFIFVR